MLLPVIRSWTRERVVDAIAASDIPRDRCILVLDAPGCDGWVESLLELDFRNLTTVYTGNPYPPEDRLERRSRWRSMRRFTQQLVEDGPLLCLEDDVLVPPDVFARLSAVGPHVTAAIMARWCPYPVVYSLPGHSPNWGSGIEDIDGCGYNCLLTTGEAYREATVLADDPGPADLEHTRQMRPLRVDWECVCGHLTEKGVLLP